MPRRGSAGTATRTPRASRMGTVILFPVPPPPPDITPEWRAALEEAAAERGLPPELWLVPPRE